MKTLELFSGTRSFSKVAESLGHSTFCVELNKNQEADLHKNILDVNIDDLPKDIDFIWASPPCTTFSVAGRKSNYTNFMPNNVKACLGLAYIYKTLELIRQINPKYFCIENPMGYLRKFPIMQNLHRVHIWYCQYGDTRAKPTDIWTNITSWDGKRCKNNNIYCHHEKSPRGSKCGTQGLKNNTERSVIPERLFYEIFKHINDKQDYLDGI